MNRILVKIAQNYQTAFFVLFMILGLQTLSVMAQAAPPTSSEPSSATEAKRILTEIDARNFVRIKDGRMRKAMQQSYKALKAIADNTSDARESKLLAEFDRTIKDLKALPQPNSSSGGGLQECDEGYKRCKELCRRTGDCKLCTIVNNGCYMSKLMIEVTKNPDLDE